MFALLVCARVWPQPGRFFKQSLYFLPGFGGLLPSSTCSTASLLRDARVLFRVAATSRVHCRSHLGVPSEARLRLCVLAASSPPENPLSRTIGAVVQGHVSTSFGNWVLCWCGIIFHGVVPGLFKRENAQSPLHARSHNRSYNQRQCEGRD